MNPAAARELFDRGSATYAPVNRVISAGLDGCWRRWVARRAAPEVGVRVLDVMTGTGEVAVGLAVRGADVTAVDVSAAMLTAARERLRRAGVSARLVRADVTRPAPLPAGPFDAVTAVFGLRYVDDPVALLARLSRFLRPDGRLVVLEFCVPRPGPVASLAALYFFHVLPKIGALLGGEPELYRVLGETTRRMGSARHIEALIEDAGFAIVERRRFGFGLVAGFVATGVCGYEPRTRREGGAHAMAT